MKKVILNSGKVALLAAVLLTGCKKDDVTAPEVTVTGGDMTISLNGTYSDPGATATDNKDGAVSVTTSGTVNEDLVGSYTITYSATDAAGNTGTATRTVVVRNDAEVYAGTYTCADPAFGSTTWTQHVTASPTMNNHIVFDMFADRTGNNTVEAVLTGGTAFTVISTTTGALGVNGCTFSYTPNGAGSPITTVSGKYAFSVKYFEERIAGGSACSAVAPTAFEDTFMQQ